MLELMGNLAVGIIIAFVTSWALTLCILAFVPLIFIGGAFQTKLMTGFSRKDKQSLEEAGKISNEAIGSIRTVVMLHKEDYFVNSYMKLINVPYKFVFWVFRFRKKIFCN